MPQDYPNPNIEASRSPDRTVNRSETDDMGLLSRIQSGDQEAMSALFDRYGTMVYSVALRVLKDTGEAEDVMQEIFVQVWKNPSAFVSGRGSLGGWLVVVARNRSIDMIRRRRHRSRWSRSPCLPRPIWHRKRNEICCSRRFEGRCYRCPMGRSNLLNLPSSKG